MTITHKCFQRFQLVHQLDERLRHMRTTSPISALPVTKRLTACLTLNLSYL